MINCSLLGPLTCRSNDRILCTLKKRTNNTKLSLPDKVGKLIYIYNGKHSGLDTPCLDHRGFFLNVYTKMHIYFFTYI